MWRMSRRLPLLLQMWPHETVPGSSQIGRFQSKCVGRGAGFPSCANALFLPFSKCGTYPPESCLFSLIGNIGAFLGKYSFPSFPSCISVRKAGGRVATPHLPLSEQLLIPGSETFQNTRNSIILAFWGFLKVSRVRAGQEAGWGNSRYFLFIR